MPRTENFFKSAIRKWAAAKKINITGTEQGRINELARKYTDKEAKVEEIVNAFLDSIGQSRGSSEREKFDRHDIEQMIRNLK